MSKIEYNKIKKGSCLTVEDRLAGYNSVFKSIKTSPDKTKQYLASTGIYTKTGRLTKAYK